MSSVIKALDAAFKPKSIAIIGASNNKSKMGGGELVKLANMGYEGNIYPVNPKEDMIQGHKAYKSIRDLPDGIDRAVIILPPKVAPQAVQECAEKGIKVAQIYSAGFGEFGEEGKALESEMLTTAQKHGMRIIGPNCMGTYSPAGKISLAKNKFPVIGSIAFVSQSGGIAVDIVNHGDIKGIHYSKVISVGNCIDLDHGDFLEYLSEDPETTAIGFYMESVKDGERFMKILKKTTPHKPVVILKGGRTESGNESVASHTGNLAGSYDIWEAMFEQSGAIAVRSVEEMITALHCIQTLQPILDGKVAMVGNGGGATVLATDVCEEAGLKFASLQDHSAQRLHDIGAAESGRNVNPVDLPAGQLAAEEGKRFVNIMETFTKDDNVSYILFHINLLPFASYPDIEGVLRKMLEPLDFIKESGKNVVGVLRTNGDLDIEKAKFESTRILQKMGIPVFSTIEQALFGINLIVGTGKQSGGGEF